jgi:hypothetical protein
MIYSLTLFPNSHFQANKYLLITNKSRIAASFESTTVVTFLTADIKTMAAVAQT